MRRIAITGGSGFVGTNAIDFYLQRDLPVVNLDVAPPQCASHRRYWKQVDILDAPSLEAIIGQFEPTEIVHLAARTDLDASADLESYRANTSGVRNLLRVAMAMPKLQRVFFASSMLANNALQPAIGSSALNFGSIYGQSKLLGEQLVQASGYRNWVIGRLTSIWGPWFGEPYRPFFRLVCNGIFASPSRSAAVKTFGYVENTVQQIDRLLLAESEAVSGRTFYLGDCPPLDIAKWAEAIANEFGAMKPRRVPLGLLRFAAKVGDLGRNLGVRLPMTSFRLRNMTTDNIIDLAQIAALTGPEQVSTEEGIRRTLRWMRANAYLARS